MKTMRIKICIFILFVASVVFACSNNKSISSSDVSVNVDATTSATQVNWG